jgi:hypothetical protein
MSQSTAIRQLVVSVLWLLLNTPGGCSALGCTAASPAARGPTVDAAATHDVGPGAHVATVNLDGAAAYAAAGAAVVMLATAMWLLWRHDPTPNKPQTEVQP